MDILLNQHNSDSESEYDFKNSQNEPTYQDLINYVDEQIELYYQNIDELWNTISTEYINNLNYGYLLNRADKKNFEKFMNTYSPINALLESRRRLVILQSRLTSSRTNKTATLT